MDALERLRATVEELIAERDESRKRCAEATEENGICTRKKRASKLRPGW